MSANGASMASLRQRVLNFAERRLPALTRLRVTEALPIRLHRRRIYVLPTLFGISFAILLLVMQLGALNYANNPALLLTCLLAAAAWMSLFSGFRSIAGVQMQTVSAAPCHAGGAVALSCRFAPDTRARPSLRLRWGDADIPFVIEPGESVSIAAEIACPKRGWMRPGRLKLWTDQPLGLFVIWSWLNPDVSVLVYPAIESTPPPLPQGAQSHGDRLAPGIGDEYSGLRDYRSGDAQRRIAWKASARHDSLLVRESEREINDDIELDYASLGGLDSEGRIRRLSAWVLAAEAAMLSYTLVLPEQRLGPGLGDLHRHACLRALALLPDAS